jgi:hypothetical protein
MINRYAGRCFRCATEVVAGAGTAERPAGGAWRVRHNDGECQPVLDASIVPEAPAARPLVGEGYYLMNDHVYNVARSRSSQRLYARRLVLVGYGRRARWLYERGAYFNLTDEMSLTVEQAARLGHLHGVCMICGRTLTDPESVERGIGPVCYGRLVNRTVVAELHAERAQRATHDGSSLSARLESAAAVQRRSRPAVATLAPGQLTLDELGHGEVL